MYSKLLIAKLLKTGLFVLLFSSSIVLAQDTVETKPIDSYSQSIPGTDASFQMVMIPGGTFTIGSSDSEVGRREDESPQRPVKIDSFWMGKFEVTFDVYEYFREKDKDNDSTASSTGTYSADAATRPSPPYEDPTFGMGKYGYPAVSMTQFAALQFCKWLYQKTGVFYRLPTEAEWEYACRAGSESAFYFGDDTTQLGDYAWYFENSDGAYHKVGEKKPNAYGLYDMHGNIAEWTLDQYTKDFYAGLDSAKNTGVWAKPKKLHPRTVKGGSWDDDMDALRSAARTRSDMKWKRRDPQLPKSFWWNTDSPFVGFRLVKPAKKMTPEEIAKFWSITLDE